MVETKGEASGGPPFREDLLVTDTFLYLGTVEGKVQRLSRAMEDPRHPFLSMRDAARIDLETGEIVESPQFLVNLEHVVLAHEFVDLTGDEGWKRLSQEGTKVQAQAQTRGRFGFRVTAFLPRAALASPLLEEKPYFVFLRPEIACRPEPHEEAARRLEGLSYVIVRKAWVTSLFGLGPA